MIATTGREGKKVTHSFPKEDSQRKRRFDALRTRGEKPDESDDDVVKFSFFYKGMRSS